MSSSDIYNAIVQQYGSPVYLADSEIFRNNCRLFRQEFQCNGREVVQAYSYKTNNLKAFCTIAREEDYGADVVSASELEMALSLGVPAHKIFYNGPLKTKDSLLKAIHQQIAIHIDSVAELELVCSLATELRVKARIAFRLTPESVEIDGLQWNKFGISVENGELDTALGLVQTNKFVELAGLHMHLGTNISEVLIYEKAVKSLTDIVVLVQARLKCQLQYIDIGGGFSARSGTIPAAIHPDEWNPISVPTVDSVVQQALDSIDPDKKITIVTEPGRVIAESAVALLMSVISVKKRDSRWIVITDGGTNLIPSTFYSKHEVAFPEFGKTECVGTGDIHGSLCTQYDLLATEVQIPRLRKGSLVVVKGVGAYNHSFSSQFVAPRPATVLVDTEGTYLARQKEPDDILWKYDA